MCRNYSPPPSFEPSLARPLLSYASSPDADARLRATIPFVACGDLDAWGDADMTYPAVEGAADAEPIGVIAAPTEPPYKEFMEKRSRKEI